MSNEKELEEKLEKLNDGCNKCTAKMCNFCPVGDVKKKIRKKLNIEQESKLKEIFKLLSKKEK